MKYYRKCVSLHYGPNVLLGDFYLNDLFYFFIFCCRSAVVMLIFISFFIVFLYLLDSIFHLERLLSLSLFLSPSPPKALGFMYYVFCIITSHYTCTK
jgi:hypothetical protein